MKSSGFFHFIFGNISAKLKAVAKIVLICGTLLGIAIAIFFFVKAAYYADTKGLLSGVGDRVSEEYIKIAFVCLFGIPIISYLTSLALYGIGTACENAPRPEKSRPAQPDLTALNAQPTELIFCAHCGGRMNPGADFCIHCGAKRTR